MGNGWYGDIQLFGGFDIYFLLFDTHYFYIGMDGDVSFPIIMISSHDCITILVTACS